MAAAWPAGAAEQRCVMLRVAELPVTMSGTQPLITGAINGKPARFLADSGAFFSLLTPESAEKHGLGLGPLPGGIIVRGAGGSERMKLTKVPELMLTGFAGGRTYEKVDFLVGGSRLGGDIDGVIGQNFLGKWDTEYDLANGFIRVFRPQDCEGDQLVYWAAAGAQFAALDFKKRTPLEPLIITSARINGKKIRVILDSGASRSILTLRAASRAGVKREDEDVSAAGLSRGFGKQDTENSIAVFDTLDLGGEVIKNARLRIGAIKISETADMLLGADFFLSHRIYVDVRENTVYFTYNGGPVFDLSRDDDVYDAREEAPAGETGAGATPATALAEGPPLGASPELEGAADVGGSVDATPKSPAPAGGSAQDSASLRRRGAASAGRRDFSAAIADFDRAIQIDAADPENYYQRALAYAQTRRAAPALADLDQALELKPDHLEALMLRGSVRAALGDEASASEDFAAAQRIEPNNSQLPLEAARAFGGAGKSGRAIAQLDAWLEKYPKDGRIPDVLQARCRLRAVANLELDLALADCDAALKKGARNSVGYNTRALVHLRLGSHAKAIDDYDEALDLQPKDAASLYGRGLAELRQGRSEQGEKDLEAAVALDPRVAEPFEKMGLTR